MKRLLEMELVVGFELTTDGLQKTVALPLS